MIFISYNSFFGIYLYYFSMQHQNDNIIGRTLYEMIEIFRTVKFDEQESKALLEYTKCLFLPHLK